MHGKQQITMEIPYASFYIIARCLMAPECHETELQCAGASRVGTLHVPCPDAHSPSGGMT